MQVSIENVLQENVDSKGNLDTDAAAQAMDVLVHQGHVNGLGAAMTGMIINFNDQMEWQNFYESKAEIREMLKEEQWVSNITGNHTNGWVENSSIEITPKKGNQKTFIKPKPEISPIPKQAIEQANTSDGGSWGTALSVFGLVNYAKTEIIDYAVRSSFKSAQTVKEFGNLRATQKAWRYANVLGKTGSKYLKYAKGVGVVGAAVGTAYSGYSAYDDYSSSREVNPWDVADFGVGVVGLGSTGLVTLGLISNPVGWGIGVGVGIYFGYRLVDDYINEP